MGQDQGNSFIARAGQEGEEDGSLEGCDFCRGEGKMGQSEEGGQEQLVDIGFRIRRNARNRVLRQPSAAHGAMATLEDPGRAVSVAT